MKVKKIISTFLVMVFMLSTVALNVSALEYDFDKTLNGSSNFSSAWTKSLSCTIAGITNGSGYYGYDTHLVNEDVCHYENVVDYWTGCIVVNGAGAEYDIQKPYGYYSDNMADVWKNHSGTKVRYRCVIGSQSQVNTACTGTTGF